MAVKNQRQGDVTGVWGVLTPEKEILAEEKTLEPWRSANTKRGQNECSGDSSNSKCKGPRAGRTMAHSRN